MGFQTCRTSRKTGVKRSPPSCKLTDSHKRDCASPTAAPFNTTSVLIDRQQNLHREEAGSKPSLDDVKETSTMSASADPITPITDQSLCHVAEMLRGCPRVGCPAPHDVEFKYFANRAAAGFTQPRYVCHGCKRDFTLGGKLRGTAEPIIRSDTSTKPESRGDDAMLAAILPKENFATTESAMVESTSAAAPSETTATFEEESMQIDRRLDQMQLLKCEIKALLVKAQITLLDIDVEKLSAEGLDLKCKNVGRRRKTLRRRGAARVQEAIKSLAATLGKHDMQAGSVSSSESFRGRSPNSWYQIIQRLLSQVDKMDDEIVTDSEMKEIVEMGKRVRGCVSALAEFNHR